LQNYGRPGKSVLVYYVFDLLYPDGYDLHSLPLLRRKELLAGIIKDLPNVRVSEHIAEHGTALFEAVVKRQVEGIVAKLANSPYVSGQRTKAWLKIKAQQRTAGRNRRLHDRTWQPTTTRGIAAWRLPGQGSDLHRTRRGRI
jgi:bifunctional non-homologous end joining protein LigD